MQGPYVYQRSQVTGGPAVPWVVHLLLADRELPDPARLHAALPRVRAVEDGQLSFAWLDHTVPVEGLAVPVAHAIALQDGPVALGALATALPQSWNWAEARDAVQRAKGALVLTDVYADGLPRAARLELLAQTVSVLVSLTRCVAVHWLPSDRLVDPEVLRATPPGLGWVSRAAVNVRMVTPTPSGEDGATEESILDTFGMAAFGLPDLQCHFTGLDQGAVAARLFGYATYLFDRGDVIEDDDAIDGTGPEGPWLARREQGLIPPERTVIDFDPGPRFNARPPEA